MRIDGVRSMNVVGTESFNWSFSGIQPHKAKTQVPLDAIGVAAAS